MKLDRTKNEKIVLGGFSRIPPIYLLSLCQTNDQKNHWLAIYKSRQILKKGLQSYFQGSESNLDWIECQKTRKAIRHWIDGWSDLYDCIYAGWPKLSRKNRCGAASPGELLLTLLEEEGEVAFRTCLGYWRVNARELGDLNREWKKAANSQKKGKSVNTAKKIKAKSKLWESQNQDRLEQVERQLERIGKRDRRIENKFEAYKQSKSEELKALLAFTHPRQQLSIVKWERGVRNIS